MTASVRPYLPIADVPDARRVHLFHPELVPVAVDHPLPWPGGQVDEVACGWHLATLSHAVYHELAPAVQVGKVLGWQHERRLEQQGIRADVWCRDKTILLSCCGTRPSELRNIRHDGDAVLVEHSQTGRVHRGFAAAWETLRGQIESCGLQPTIATGHSLGGALAILAGAELSLAGVVAFGCPRVGDRAFAESLASTPILRYQVTADVVGHLPPQRLGFYHSGRLALLADGRCMNDPDSDLHTRSRRRGQWRYAWHCPWRFPSALWFRELADHAVHGYAHLLHRLGHADA